MYSIENNLIFEKYLLTELFDSFYNIDEIKAVFAAGIERNFTNFDKIFAYHLKYENTNPVYFIKCFFDNKSKNTIEILIYPSSKKSNIFEKDILETFVVLFRPKDDPSKMKMDSNDASVVTSTVMNCMLLFLNSYKKLINKTTNDWDDRTQKGIFLFEPYPNMSMNKVSKQFRYDKEQSRGYTQRENIYKSAFNKIIKPLYPELNLDKTGNRFIIKS